MIIENKNFLNHPEAEEQEGALALIDVDSVHILQPHEFGAECVRDCAEGYFAWQLSNIRPSKIMLKRVQSAKFIELKWIM